MAANAAGRFLLSGASMAQASGFDVSLSESVVLVYDTALIPARSTRRRHQRSQHPFRQIGSLTDGVDIVVAPGPGAPVAAITVEFLAAFGVKRLVAVGTAGLLTPGASPSRHYVISNAISDEGTSAHYSSNLRSDPALTAALVAELGGGTHSVVTTDVPFRHTQERLATHRSSSALVEMECAAMFAAAHCFGLAAAAVLMPSDHFGVDRWTLLSSTSTDDHGAMLVDTAASVLGRSTAATGS